MSESASLGVLLDYTQDKIVLVDEGGTVTYCNQAVERMLGYAPEEHVGENIFEQIHPDDRETAMAAFEDTIGRDEYAVGTAELRYRAADGSWVHLESRMTNLTDDELGGYVVCSRDISDRVAAQRERERAVQQLRELSTTTQDVLWMFDGDWEELLFVNPAYETLFGQSVETVQDDPSAFLDAIHPDDVPAVRDAMETLSAGTAVDVEYRVNPETDYGTWLWVQGHPIVEDGEVVRITGFCRDVTDRRRRERQLVVMDNLLRHNIRNDMTVILGEAELIDEGERDVADGTRVIRQTGQDLLASSEKQREIIDVLSGQQDVAPVDLDAVVAEAVEATRERYPDAEIERSSPGATEALALDEIHLAVRELLENGLRHCERERPSVRVGVEGQTERVAIRVEDDADELSEMEANVLRGAHETSGVYHSSGLGLWLVYWVVELSGGGITVEHVPDGGNRVEVTLRRPRE